MKSIAHGNIAIQIAIRHPGRVRKPVVASATFKIDELEPEEDTVSKWFEENWRAALQSSGGPPRGEPASNRVVCQLQAWVFNLSKPTWNRFKSRPALIRSRKATDENA